MVTLVIQNQHRGILMKIKKGGWKYLIIGLLVGMASAVICLAIGAPQVVANAIPTGVAAATIFSLKSKWMA
ncbi:MAG: putative flippase GtrA [Colwellia sp.]|jgi:putative flippase GtrA